MSMNAGDLMRALKTYPGSCPVELADGTPITSCVAVGTERPGVRKYVLNGAVAESGALARAAEAKQAAAPALPLGETSTTEPPPRRARGIR